MNTSPPEPAPATTSARFWIDKTLAELTLAEWDALCDGCGKCCLHKLEDEDTGQLFYTNVACRLLNLTTARCSRYADRFRWVPDCVPLTPAEVQRVNWLPSTCAYRLLAEGRPLPDWHPLLTGDPDSTRRAGVSVCGWAVPEQRAKQLGSHIIECLP